MRWLFLLLLIANIAYVGWGLTREPVAEDSGAVTTVKPDTPRIVLLRELHDGSSTPALAQAGEQSGPVPTAAADAPPTTAVADAGAAADEPPGVADRSPVEAPAEPADEQADRRDRAAQDQPPGEDRCYTLGPFRDRDQLDAFTRVIKSHAVDTGFRSRDEKEQSMFWVFLDSTGSLAQARELSDELVSRGIKDYFIIGSGEHKYGISLGQFSAKERAYRHAKRIRELGFEPVVEPVFRTYTIYWLDYRMKAADAIPPQVFEEGLPESVSRLDRPCQP